MEGNNLLNNLIRHLAAGILPSNIVINEDGTIQFVEEEEEDDFEEEEEEEDEEENASENSRESSENTRRALAREKRERQLKEIQTSDLAQSIKMNTGYFPDKRPKNCVELLAERRTNRRISSSWNASLLHRFIPEEGRMWERYRNHVFCGQYSKDGELFMSACQDRKIRIYDHATKKKVKEINARHIGWSIIDTDYSPDQRWLIYSSWSDYIHLCNIVGDVDTHEALDVKPEANRFCLFSVKFSPDSHEILGGSSDKHIYIYNLERREVEHRIEAHRDDINTVAYAESDNGNIILTGSDDNICKVWDRRILRNDGEAKAAGCFIGHSSGITHVSAKGDGRYFISNGKDQTIKLWDLRKAKSNDDDVPMTGSSFDYRFGFSRLSSRASHPEDHSIMQYTGHQVNATLIRAYFSPINSTGQKYIYSGSSDGNVHIWDVLTGELVKRIPAHDSVIRDLSWHPYEPLITTTSWDSTMRSWDLIPSGVPIERRRINPSVFYESYSEEEDDV
eukprot:TRINITY_DN2023_c0_g1_i1.p1 TRINITY_DN2023_c0_g1~~TRINITY_DN2023_c0_g1_i1.p1  ORF type:complete len:506 (+),score=174.87 TRINITY_DN2023_c0_g1_i1:98-1615(+)